MKKLRKYRLLRDRLILSAAILARWRQPVASGVALDPLYRVMRTVRYQRIAMAIGMASKQQVIFHHHCFACNPDGLRGDTVQILTQWWRPLASSEALNPLHWLM